LRRTVKKALVSCKVRKLGMVIFCFDDDDDDDVVRDNRLSADESIRILDWRWKWRKRWTKRETNPCRQVLRRRTFCVCETDSF
jgi:hypothetical protein